MVRGLTSVLLMSVAAAVYGLYGFQGLLTTDGALYLYGGQRFAQGVPPYVGAFDIKGPLGPMLVGLPVAIANRLGWNDLFTVRAAWFLLSCLAVVAVYWTGTRLFQSPRAGPFAALTFLGFFGFARYAASGPETKSAMLVFEILALYFVLGKGWFRASLFGTLASLVWQPAGVFPLATLVVAAAQPARDRARAVSGVILGLLLPLLACVGYFLAHGALGELLDGAVLFPIRYLDRGPISPLGRVVTPVGAMLAGYRTMVLPILIAWGVWLLLTVRRFANGSAPEGRLSDPFTALVLPLPVLAALSFLDFGGPSDWYVFLPYMALGFGWFLARAVQEGEPARAGGRHSLLPAAVAVALVAVGGINVLAGREAGLVAQRHAAAEIVRRFGPDVRVVSVGVPELLALLHRINPSPYVRLNSGIDRRLAATTLNGFPGWIQQLAAYDPDIIGVDLGRMGGSQRGKLFRDWLESGYQPERVGPWTIYIRIGPPGAP